MLDDPDDVTRRVVVQQLAFAAGGVVLLGGCRDPAVVDAGAAKLKTAVLTSSHLTFTDDEFRVVSAAAERLLPRDEDPGAIDLGVPGYIDRILQTEPMRKTKEDFVPGVAALNRRSQRMFKVPFDQATQAQQDELITAFKSSPETSGEARWYELLLVLTMEGAFGDPSYGGNQGEAGWKLMGFTLVGRNVKGDPAKGYDGAKHLHDLRCGGGKGC